jgi:transposase-like protein
MSRPRKREAALRLLRGEELEMVSRSLGVTAAALPAWCDTFLAGGEAALAARPADGETLASERLKARLGEMLLREELLEEKIAASEAGRPFCPKDAEAMSQTTSPSHGKPYGLARVCRVWGATARPSAIIASRRAQRRQRPAGPMPDAELLEAIRAVLGFSPFHGVGPPQGVGEAVSLRDLQTAAAGFAADARERSAHPLAGRCAARATCP